MSWIESHQELRNHPKTKRLAKRMGTSVPTVIGYLHCLWWWAADYAPDGDLTEYEAWEIADAAYYEGENPEEFISALVDARFLDVTEDARLTLHDWQDYGGKNIQRQKAASERARKYRERQKTETDENAGEESYNDDVTRTKRERNANVTRTKRERNAYVTGDRTGQDNTLQDNITPLTPLDGGNRPEKPPDESLRTAVNDWIEYRKEINAPLNPRSIGALRDKVRSETDKHGAKEVEKRIRESIANGYKGIVWDKSPPFRDNGKDGITRDRDLDKWLLEQTLNSLSPENEQGSDPGGGP